MIEGSFFGLPRFFGVAAGACGDAAAAAAGTSAGSAGSAGAAGAGSSGGDFLSRGTGSVRRAAVSGVP